MLASEQLATTQSQRAQTQTQPAPTTPTTPALAPREAVQEEEAEEQVRSPSWPFPRTRRVVFGPPTRAARRERDADAVARPFIPRAAPSDLPSSPIAQLCFFDAPGPQRLPSQALEQLPQSFVCIDDLQQAGISATDIKARVATRVISFRSPRVLPPLALTRPLLFVHPRRKSRRRATAPSSPS